MTVSLVSLEMLYVNISLNIINIINSKTIKFFQQEYIIYYSLENFGFLLPTVASKASIKSFSIGNKKFRLE
jgi:hypothetical protein